LYVLVFLAAALYASLLLLTAMQGLQSTQNSLVYACGIIFIFRAAFAARAAILRLRSPAEAQPKAGFRRISATMFGIGDLFAVASLILTARILWIGDFRLNAPVVPFGMGLAIGYLFYLFAIALRFADK
jgi:hypothetical protein